MVDQFTQDQQNCPYLKESDNLLTPGDLEKLKMSMPYTKGIKAIELARESKHLSAAEFTAGRPSAGKIYHSDRDQVP